nr:hypothetical protein [Mycobacterium lepraemurium]
MHVEIGLPSYIAHVPGRLTVERECRAEHRGFAGLAAIDRLVYPSLDAMTALAVTAGATTGIG